MGFFDSFKSNLNELKKAGSNFVNGLSSVNDLNKDSVSDIPPPPPVYEVPREFSPVYIAVDGSQFGPFGEDEFAEMISTGSVTPETLVFVDGMSDWEPAHQVSQISGMFAMGAIDSIPPPPPLPFAPNAPVSAAPYVGTCSVNGMSDKLNALIEAAVADGEITDLERQVLIRNAQAEGVCMDEFVVMLEARLFEQRKMLKAEEHMQKMPPSAPVAPMTPTGAPRDNNTQKMGSLRKCPACNAVINKVDACACPQCGYEFSSTAVGIPSDDNPIRPLIDKLDAIDAEFQGMNPLKQMFSPQAIFQRKSTAISSFAVPNNKKAVINFLMYATTSYNSLQTFDPFKKIWKAKCEEVLRLAKINFNDDEKVAQVMESTAKTVGIKLKKL